MKVVLFGFTPITALGITTAFSQQPELLCPTSARSSARLLEEAASETVQLVLIDPCCPTLDAGFDLCKEIKQLPSPPRIVVFGTVESHLQETLSSLAGADSFVTATESPERLTDVALSTLQGKREWLLGPPVETPTSGPAAASGLTHRENEVLWRLFHRCTNQQIARSLGISPATVKNHVASILRKTGAKRRTELCSGMLVTPERPVQPVSRTAL